MQNIPSAFQILPTVHLRWYPSSVCVCVCETHQHICGVCGSGVEHAEGLYFDLEGGRSIEEDPAGLSLGGGAFSWVLNHTSGGE